MNNFTFLRFRKISLIKCILFFLVIGNTAFSQTTALTVSGEVETPLDLKLEDLFAFKQITEKVTDRDGKEHEFSGVALVDILSKAGVTLGAKLRGENLVKYVLITAADGYEVVYALAEIDPEFTDQIVLLATQKDGKPLGTGEGPLRIVAGKDKKPARWIREVRSVKVLFAKN
ncbi:MAG TPA: molybdopterin-dependent oxidoreductase [Dyadobacter sp.]|jgi:DMSO/TMAO reductase YedYZ molybdopterin-dependent catalytic subunit|nr:molybdopterin-dependent oxidoreductase [Dyadobacter sp.]